MKNSPDKIERMKEVLADSFPKTAEEDRQALPAAARQLLEKSSPAATEEAHTQSIWQRVGEFLRGPQLIGLGAAALVVVMATLHFSNPSTTETPEPSGPSFRSGSGEDLPAQLVVLKNLSANQTKAIQDSGYFQKEQVVILGTEELETYQDHQVVLVDGTTGEITTPFATTTSPQTMASDLDELVSQIVDALATFEE